MRLAPGRAHVSVCVWVSVYVCLQTCICHVYISCVCVCGGDAEMSQVWLTMQSVQLFLQTHTVGLN